jgi:hypothetical protein
MAPPSTAFGSSWPRGRPSHAHRGVPQLGACAHSRDGSVAIVAIDTGGRDAGFQSRRASRRKKKGTPNRASAARERCAQASGLTPLEYLRRIMRNPKLPRSERTDAAKAAAPYVHPRFAAVAQLPITDDYDLSKLSDEELEQLDQLLERAATVGAGCYPLIESPR